MEGIYFELIIIKKLIKKIDVYIFMFKEVVLRLIILLWFLGIIC